MKLRPTLYRHGTELYLVLRQMPINKFVHMDAVKLMRDHLNAEHVLKYKGTYMFVESIPELEIISE